MLAGILFLTTLVSAVPADAERCPEIFGDTAARRYGADLAQYQIHRVSIDSQGVTLFHSVGAWHKVETARFGGFRVERVSDDEAVVHLEPRTGDTDACRGRFVVHVGDHVGAERTIVAMLPDAILIGSKRALVQVVAHDVASAPPVELVWQSDYHLLGVSVARPSASKNATVPKRAASMTNMAKPNLTSPLGGARARPAVKAPARSTPRSRPSIK